MRGGLAGWAAPERPAPASPAPRAGAAVAVRAVPGERPDALLYVVLGVILTDVWRLHDLIPGARALRPSIALTLLGLVLLAAYRGVSPALSRLRSPIAAWFAVFIGLMLVGLPFSLDLALSADFMTSVVLLRAMIAFLVAASVRSIRDAEFLALGTLAGACVYIVAHLGRPVDGEGRWTALTYYDVNDLGLMLVVMFPLALYFIRRANATPRRVFAAISLVLLAYATMRTGSRGGFIGFAAVLAYLLLRYEAVSLRTRTIGVAVAIAVLVIGGQAYRDRLVTIVRPRADYNWSSETGRMGLWRRGLDYVASRPVFGLGVNQFRTAESRLWTLSRQSRMAGRRPPRATGPHNMLLQVAAELGLPALIAFVMVLAMAWRTVARLSKRRTVDGSPGPALSGALAASLLGFFVCGMFLHAAFFPVLPLLLGFAVGLVSIGEARAPAVRARRGGLFAINNAPPRVPA